MRYVTQRGTSRVHFSPTGPSNTIIMVDMRPLKQGVGVEFHRQGALASVLVDVPGAYVRGSGFAGLSAPDSTVGIPLDRAEEALKVVRDYLGSFGFTVIATGLVHQ